MQGGLWNNIIIIGYFLIWIFTFFEQKRRSKSFGPASFIKLTYAIYAFFSILLINNAAFGHNYDELSIFPFVYLYIMLLIALKPISIYESKRVVSVQMPSNILINLFIIIYGICALISLPSSFSRIQNNLIAIFTNKGSAVDIYLNAHANYVVSDSSVSGLYGLLSIFHNFFRDISIFVLFYYLSLKNRSRFLSIYLLIVLMVDMLLSLANGGRTDVIMMLLTVGVSYFMFRDFWTEKYRKIVQKVALVFLAVIMVPFMYFTISRLVGAKVTYTPYDSIVLYTGQANLNFNNRVLASNGIRYGDRTINEFKRILGFTVPMGINNTRLKYSNMTINDSVFSTFVGDFVLDFGPIVALLLFVVYNSFIIYITNSSKNSVQFHKLLMIFFSGSICAQGGMYLFDYSFQKNWVIVAFFLMYVILKIDYSYQLKHDSLRFLKREPDKNEGYIKKEKD